MNMISLIGLIEALLSPLLQRISALGLTLVQTSLSGDQWLCGPGREEQTGDIAGTMKHQLLHFIT